MEFRSFFGMLFLRSQLKASTIIFRTQKWPCNQLPDRKFYIWSLRGFQISHQMTKNFSNNLLPSKNLQLCFSEVKSWFQYAILLANCQLHSKAARRPSWRPRHPLPSIATTSSFATSKEAVFSENLTARIEICVATLFFPAGSRYRISVYGEGISGWPSLAEWSTV